MNEKSELRSRGTFRNSDRKKEGIGPSVCGFVVKQIKTIPIHELVCLAFVQKNGGFSGRINSQWV